MSTANGKLRSSRDIVMNGGVRFRAAAEPFEMAKRWSANNFSNNLIASTTQSDANGPQNPVDYDFHRTITSNGRRVMYSLARTMFWKIPVLQAAILEQASITANPFVPRYSGSNVKWGDAAYEWLTGTFHPTMCEEGWPNDYDSYTETLVSQTLVDGELHTLLTEDTSGNARTQFIPTHRIGARNMTGGTAKVTYDGNRLFIDDVLIDDSLPYTFANKVEWTAPIVDGCIIDAQCRTIAFRTYDDPQTGSAWRDLSARSCFPSFFPFVTGQLRGISAVASSAGDWQNWREWRDLEQLAQKVFSTQTIVETNETGDGDAAKALITQAATFNDDGSKAGLDVQKLQGGLIRYIKAKSGGDLKAFTGGDRPGRNPQDFQEMTLRDAMKGTEWDVFFSLDPKSVGGAPMRVIIDRINRVIKKRRRLLKKSVYRTHVYAIAKAIKRGDLPFDPEWFSWTYTGSPDLTADRRYDSQTDEMEYDRGWITEDDVASRRAADWLKNRKQKEIEVRDLFTRAKALADEFKISIQEAANRLSLQGAQSFSMARRDQGDNALIEDSSQPATTPKKGLAASSDWPLFNVSVNDKARPRKRTITHKRDARGVILASEMIEE